MEFNISFLINYQLLPIYISLILRKDILIILKNSSKKLIEFYQFYFEFFYQFYFNIYNYEEIVSKYIDDYKIRRDELICLCPFHDEDTPSFNFNIKTGLFKCFGCGESGNAVTFVAKMEGISTKEAWKKLHLKYTVNDYSREKKLPVDFLEKLGLKDEENNISMPYLDEKKK